MPLPELLFVIACLGHFLLGLRIYNWCYGGIVNEYVSDTVRPILSLLLAAAPFLYWWFFGVDGLAPLSLATESIPAALVSVYLIVCWSVALVVFPVVQLRRGLRRPAPALVSNHTRTVDVTAELGFRPVGHCEKHNWLGRLPGNEIYQVDLTEKILRTPRLPAAWDGLTILHLSDLHFSGTPDRPYFRRVVELCSAWQPDLIALTGDIVDSEWHHRWVLPLLGRLRSKMATFAILGNHDYRYDVEMVRRRLRRCGMRVLVNNWETLDVRGEPLVVIGHEGPWLPTVPNLEACPAGPFRLCLSHTPDNIAWARRNAIDLMLSGHVHGGQIRLPLMGSVFVPSRYGRRYDAGTYAEPPTLLHVSRGLSGEHPVRYNCRPEVTLLTLRSSLHPRSPA
jgi:predicted MPP superfamily phosphohydrolase